MTNKEINMSHEEKCDCKGDACECESGCDCGCAGECDCGGLHFDRLFQTKAEQVEELEAYLSELKLEVQAVEEHLADLRK
jgi:hypothetical protein